MIKNSDDKLIIDRVEDLYSKCEKYGCAVFGSFLDEEALALAEDNVRPAVYTNTLVFGGYDGAERKMYGVFPEWEEPLSALFPIRCIRISYTFGVRLSHRDYLGAILGLGLDRSKIGDILVVDDGAYVFVCEETAEYIASNLEKVGNRGIKCTLTECGETDIPKPHTELVSCVAASLRPDAIVSSMLGISRSTAARLIKEEKVFINHRICAQCAGKLSPSDTISVRGYGKFVFVSAEGTTRSGRIHITLNKYV